MEGVTPGERRPITLTNLPPGLVGTVGVRVEDADNVVTQPRTTLGISEFAAGTYRIWIAFPETESFVYVIGDDGAGVEAIEEFRVTRNAGATVEIGPLYATADGLRSALKLTAEVLPDDEANETLSRACDLIDERLGNRPIDPDTGRKVIPDNEDAWRVRKLAEATIEIAVQLYNDPGVESRQRARFSSGDVSVSGFYGPAFGERSAALLNQSGLAVNTARMSGGTPRRR